VVFFFFFQAEDGIRDLVRSRGLGDVYKRQALDVAERLDAGEAFVARSLTARANIDFDAGDYASARSRLTRAAEIWRGAGPDQRENLIVALLGLSAVEARLDDSEAAIAGYRETIAAIEPSPTGWEDRLARAYRNLGGVLQEAGRFPEAVAAFRGSLRIHQASVAADSVEAKEVAASLKTAEFLAGLPPPSGETESD